MKNLTNAEKPAPLDYIQPEKPWGQFWAELWSHDLFGILFIALAIGFTVLMLERGEDFPDWAVIVFGLIGASCGLLWLLTA